MSSRKHHDRQCHVFSICHTLFVMSTSRMSWSNSLFPCCKGLSRCGQKCGASSRGPSFISFIVTGCHVLGQTASVLYCGLRHIVLYHIRRHKHMFYLPFIRSLCVEWMCVFFRRRWEPTLIEDTIRFWPYRTNGACMETRTVRVRDLIATYNACK